VDEAVTARQNEAADCFSPLDTNRPWHAKTTSILKLRDITPWESLRPLLEDLTGYATPYWAKSLSG
jgi:hypothetical protein